MTPAIWSRSGFPTELRQTRADLRQRATGHEKKFPVSVCPAGHESIVRRCVFPKRVTALRPAPGGHSIDGGRSLAVAYGRLCSGVNNQLRKA